MSEVLSTSALTSSAPGKTILMGEHAAVYGFPAVAAPLPDVRVHVFLSAPDERPPSSWGEAFAFEVCGASVALDEGGRRAFEAALQSAVEILLRRPLGSFVPQRLLIRSEIPLGAGMGGSAALCVALLRLFSQVDSARHASNEQEFMEWANTLEKHFHGNPSGLDVAAVLAQGPIVFEKGNGALPVRPGADFWLLLVDSGSRSLTIDMVNHVSSLRAQAPTEVDLSLARLGALTQGVVEALQHGELKFVGNAMNCAHTELASLGLSTPLMDEIAAGLRQRGALGAKLTGAGGGGFVIGLFAAEPSFETREFFNRHRVFRTKIAVATERG
jgi:mevalonate kinase